MARGDIYSTVPTVSNKPPFDIHQQMKLGCLVDSYIENKMCRSLLCNFLFGCTDIVIITWEQDESKLFGNEFVHLIEVCHMP
jgi:hypothetical protein